MSINTKTIATLISIIIGLVAVILIVNKSPLPSVGSVTRGGEYQATSTYPVGAAALYSTLISNTNGTLGSIIVSSTTVGTLKVKNATSTSDVASTTIATFGASPANGTYTFDAIITRGLIIELSPGFTGGYTITYRE